MGTGLNFQDMKLLVTFSVLQGQRECIAQSLGDRADLLFLEDFPDSEKNKLIASSDLWLSWNPGKETLYHPDLSEGKVKFIQLLSAGYDHVRLDAFPGNVTIAANQGAYAAPMAEHAVAMILSLFKKLSAYHRQLAGGAFRQLESMTKSVSGSTLGIVGFGGIGKASARLMKSFNVKVMGINTRGETDEPVDFIGTLKDLETVLRNSDSVLLSCPLNEQTEGLMDKRKLELMKDDAVLVNVARGPVIRQKDLFEHLRTHPDFQAGIDAWWVEPFKSGKFTVDYPFFDLPNFIGSPHNSAMVADALLSGTAKAMENVKRFLRHERPTGVISGN